MADVLVATDCMSPDLDSPTADGNDVPACYRETVDKNTGVIAVRPSRAQPARRPSTCTAPRGLTRTR